VENLAKSACAELCFILQLTMKNAMGTNGDVFHNRKQSEANFNGMFPAEFV